MMDQPGVDDDVAGRKESASPRSKPEIALQAARDLIKAIDDFTRWADIARSVSGYDPTAGNSARTLGENALLTLARLDLKNSPFDEPNRHLHLWPPSLEEIIDPEWYLSPERTIQDIIVSGLSYLNIVLKPAANDLIDALEYSPETVFAKEDRARQVAEHDENDELADEEVDRLAFNLLFVQGDYQPTELRQSIPEQIDTVVRCLIVNGQGSPAFKQAMRPIVNTLPDGRQVSVEIYEYAQQFGMTADAENLMRLWPDHTNALKIRSDEQQRELVSGIKKLANRILEEEIEKKGVEAKQETFTLLDRFPVTPLGHVQFIEFVRDEVHLAAEAKRQQLAREYSNDTLVSIVQGIHWVEATKRLSTLVGLLGDAADQVANVLCRKLGVGTVDQIDDILTPVVRVLRDAWESSNGENKHGDVVDTEMPEHSDEHSKDRPNEEESDKVPIERPPERAIQAWRLRDLKGWTQQNIAAHLNTNQGQVSRWIAMVKEYLAAGNVLPDLPVISKPESVDPGILEMGTRKDGRTPR